MPVVNPEKFVALQHDAERLRNICILAHVDHGKTSLADALIATNGIISPKLAGKIRYLDSRPDEQLRGITMESSAISLYFALSRRAAAEEASVQHEYMINLVDSPGHIDFSSEVSTASRLCDGALVLVDAVEGVCSQTVTVLRQTWVEHLKPLLVINKIDRLITELKMSPTEAYTHLSKLLEQVNAVIGSFFQGERMEEDLQWRERVEERVTAAAAREQGKAERKMDKSSRSIVSDKVASTVSNDVDGEFQERDDEDLYFAPETNNVIFSSAVDGWAFTVRQFATLYEKKLGIKRSTLEKVLWGDFYLEPKTRRVLGSKHLKGRALKPMFVQLVLDNIWATYEATTGGSKGKGDPAMVDKIVKSLSLTIPPHVLRSRDPRALLTAVFAAWLPLSTAVLVSVIEYLPSPPVAQASRLLTLIDNSPAAEHVDRKVRDATVRFQTNQGVPVVAYVSKMVAVRASELPQNKRKAGGGIMAAEEAREFSRQKRMDVEKARKVAEGESSGDIDGLAEALTSTEVSSEQETTVDHSEDLEHLIGFARLYSGTLNVGDEVYILPPKFSPGAPHAAPEPQKVTVTGLYLMMGRGLESLKSVPAGAVFGIAGLEGHILKSATLCSQLDGSVNLAGVNMGSQPIVRVALEPVNPGDLDKMINGMQLLEQSDPCAVYEVLESGEHVILTAGELHLERCLKDLRERFARCEIQAGEPIVPYRETIVDAPEMAAPKDKAYPRGTVVAVTPSKQITVRLRVRPLPAGVTEFLDKNVAAIGQFYSERTAKETAKETAKQEDQRDNQASTDDEETRVIMQGSNSISSKDLKAKLQEVITDAAPQLDVLSHTAEKIVAFGPRRTGPNLLVDLTGSCPKFFQGEHETTQPADEEAEEGLQTSTLKARDFSDKILYAFQLATAQGPLCSEPCQGLAVFIEEVTIATASEEESSSSDTLGRLTGEIIKTVRDAVRQGFMDWSPRLLLAMYSCEIQASTEVLGRVYAVITRRRGRIIAESLNEGTPFFTILSVLPVAESFGFSEEIRKRTSGAASPQLVFQGFEMLDEDPFWVPFTEDELEDLGELADRENVAKRYMDKVRMRKGLAVKGQKLVRDAEKQKTLKR